MDFHGKKGQYDRYLNNFDPYNQEFGKTYISVCTVHGHPFFIKHDELLSKEDMQILNNEVSRATRYWEGAFLFD